MWLFIPQDFIITILDALYRDRDYARFFVLETIARVPYFGEGPVLLHACDSRSLNFAAQIVCALLLSVLMTPDYCSAFISVLHLYETFGWWRRADYIKVHFAESMNEFHHLLIMEVC